MCNFKFIFKCCFYSFVWICSSWIHNFVLLCVVCLGTLSVYEKIIIKENIDTVYSGKKIWVIGLFFIVTSIFASFLYHSRFVRYGFIIIMLVLAILIITKNRDKLFKALNQ